MATAGNNLSDYSIEELQIPANKRIGIVVAEWNEQITNGLLQGALEVLHQLVSDSQLLIKYVPGSYELPLGAQYFFEANQADAVICIGSVVRGETAHFDYVCQAASQGVLQVGLKYNAPCIFCVLTDDTMQQSIDRSGGKHGNKGTEAAVALAKMLALKLDINSDG